MFHSQKLTMNAYTIGMNLKEKMIMKAGTRYRNISRLCINFCFFVLTTKKCSGKKLRIPRRATAESTLR